MWKLFFTFIFLIIATPSMASEPRWQEIPSETVEPVWEVTPSKVSEPTWKEIKKMEIIFQSLNAIDAVQTIDCLNREICYEVNPLLGKYPSTEKIIAIKATSGIIHYIITKELYKRNPKSARIFQYVTIGIQGSVVVANMRFVF